MIVIIKYGAGNLFSVRAAIQRLGYEALISSDFEVIRKADKVIFPGVGEASFAMSKLKETGLDKLIPKLNNPVLGICLGMQLMCEYSEEGDTKGLGIFSSAVRKFDIEHKIPHMGWNNIYDFQNDIFNGIEDNEMVYFVHSYYVPVSENTIAKCNYGLEFSAAIQKNNFWGCQFHPEKSSSTGEKILKNFLES